MRVALTSCATAHKMLPLILIGFLLWQSLEGCVSQIWAMAYIYRCICLPLPSWYHILSVEDRILLQAAWLPSARNKDRYNFCHETHPARLICRWWKATLQMECAPLGWEQILSQGSLLVFWKRMNHSSSEALLQMPSKNLVTIRQMVSPDACSFLALPHAMYYRRLGTQQNSFPAESRLQTKDYFSNYLQNQGTTSISCPM